LTILLDRPFKQATRECGSPFRLFRKPPAKSMWREGLRIMFQDTRKGVMAHFCRRDPKTLAGVMIFFLDALDKVSHWGRHHYPLTEIKSRKQES
jgi:hypothetical protein